MAVTPHAPPRNQQQPPKQPPQQQQPAPAPVVTSAPQNAWGRGAPPPASAALPATLDAKPSKPAGKPTAAQVVAAGGGPFLTAAQNRRLSLRFRSIARFSTLKHGFNVGIVVSVSESQIPRSKLSPR